MRDKRRKAWVLFAALVAMFYIVGPVGLTPAAQNAQNGEGSAVSCFTIADEGDGTSESVDGDAIEDLLTKADPDDADPATNETTIDFTGTMSVESLSIHPETAVLYGVDGDQLGTFDEASGAFTPTAEPVGTGSGDEGEVAFDNVDGLTFDPDSGTLYASQREDGPDLLLVIDPATGAHVNDAFGTGADYAVIDPVAGLTDINDLAIDADGTMFGIANEDDEDDHLVEIEPANGNTTDVGAAGVDDVEGLDFHPDGRLFGTVSVPTGGLVDIDPATGAASNRRTLDNGADYEGIACQRGEAPHEPNVTGLKWDDTNGDGVRDEGEHGLAGVEIHIFNEDGSLHEHTTTGSDGTYGFLVEPGTYTVCETVPGGFTQTFPTEGADCTAHEPVDHIGPWGWDVTIEGDEVSDGNDFGNTTGGDCPPGDATISGTKWDDANRDGARDEDELGVAGVTIRAVRTDPASPAVTCETHTGEDGSYSLTVPAGTYTVCEVLPSGRTQTFPTEGPDCAEITGPGTFGHEVTVAAGEGSSGNDFGNALDEVAACSNGEDDDGDGFEDARDPGCYVGFDMSDPANYDPNDDDEVNPTCADDLDEDGVQHGPSNLEGDETGLVSGIVHIVDDLLPIPGVLGDGSLVADTVNCSIVVGSLGL